MGRVSVMGGPLSMLGIVAVVLSTSWVSVIVSVRGLWGLGRIVNLTLASRSPWIVGLMLTGGMGPSSVKKTVIF